MKAIRQFGSLLFVMGIFVVIFIGVPFEVMTSEDPVVPWFLRVAIFAVLVGILLVLLTVALDKKNLEIKPGSKDAPETDSTILLSNSETVAGKEIAENLGLVQGHTVFAIWLGKDLSAILRLVIGGELTEYTDMMGKARTVATNRMIKRASKLGADAIIDVRYMTTSVVGTAAELFAYGTAVKLRE